MTRHVLQLSTPADYFCDAFPIGNGSVGGMIYGRPGRERIDLNVDTLWSGGPLPAVPATLGPSAAVLPRLREAIREGDYVVSEKLAEEFQADGWTQSYQPVGWLEWAYADAVDGPYARELDLADAEVRTVHSTANGEIVARSFVSQVDGVMVVSLTGAGLAAAGPASPLLHSPHPIDQEVVELDEATGLLLASGRAPATVVPNYVPGDPAVIYGDDEPDAAGTVAAGMGFAVAGLVQRMQNEHRLIVSVVSGFRGVDSRPSADASGLREEARGIAAAVSAVSTEELRARHRTEHRGYFDRVDLDLSGSQAVAGAADPARAELYFDVGRYLLISSSRPGTQAANLQGIWNIDVRPGWSSNYTTNINVEMNYWGAEPLGLPELHGPMLDLIDDLVRAGRPSARYWYGAAGAVAHHNTDLWRFTAAVHGDPVWSNWPSALLWMAAHLWDHLDYAGTVDAETRQHVFRVHREIAAFTLDMLVPDVKGELVWSPSTTPEHKFVTDSGAYAVSEGGSMDAELSREVLQRFVQLAAEEQVTDELVDRAGDALRRLHPVGRGSKGQLLEWYDDRTPAEWGHRHLSQLYGVYPGTRITETGTPEDFAAAREALRIRLDNGSGYTGWSQAWVLCLAARFADPDLAERSLWTLTEELCSPSMMDFHPHGDWPGGVIFQIDGNLGAIAGVAQLIAQDHDGVISLLRSVPPSWTVGRARGLRLRGGHIVDVSWDDHRPEAVRVEVGRPGPIVLELPPGEDRFSVSDVDGRGVEGASIEVGPFGRVRLRWIAAETAQTYLVARV